MESETEKNKPAKDQEQTVEKVELRLGDIIRIDDPEDEDLNHQTFLIDYIDELRMNLINTKTFDTKKLPINDGIVAGDTITKIALISRNPELGFARQNGLITGVWVNITFEGDTPVIFVGQITNLENDMIEIKTIDGDVLYIDFEYKGVPEHLELKSIEIRDEPPKKATQQPSLEEGDIVLDEEESEGPRSVPQEKNIKEQLREIILNADQVVFLDEELGPIKYLVEVSEKKQRYSIDAQVTDLLDDLLSTIPNNQRTDFVMEKIHLMIERFKQLRTQFSTFDANGNVTGRLINGPNYKPLTKYFKELDTNLYWIVPIVKNVKKIYDIIEENGANDVEDLSMQQEVKYLIEKLEQYKSNSIQYNKYLTLYTQINPFFTPFKLVDDETPDGILLDKGAGTDLCVIADNLDDLKSSAIINNKLKPRKFMVERYNQGLTRLDLIEDSRLSHRIPMTPNDILSITSFLMLPEPVIRFSRINLPGTNLMDKAMLNQTSLQMWRLLNQKTSVKSVLVADDVPLGYCRGCAFA